MKARRELQALLWDNDGVLVDTEHLYCQATRDTLAKVGVDLTLEMFIRISLREGRSVFDLALQRGLPADTVEKLRDERNDLYRRRLESGVAIMRGVERTLQVLAGHVRMGVVTSARREHFLTMHRSTGLMKYFEFFLTSDDFNRSKPDPEPYLLAVCRNGLEKDGCLIVEDTERGLLSARAAGIRCVVIPNALTRGGDFTGAYRVLNHAGELLPLVLPWLPSLAQGTTCTSDGAREEDQ